MTTPISSKRHFPEIDKKNCIAVVDSFLRHEESDVFRDPVDWELFGLMDYPDIIKKPMDLSTVKKGLTKNKYTSKDEFAAEMKLIWTNAIKYNEDGSDINKQAGKYLKLFDELFQNMVLAPAKTFMGETTAADKAATTKASRNPSIKNEGEDANTVPNKQDMENFAELIQKLNPIDRGRTLLLIDELCRSCLSKPEHNELEIQVDAMEEKTFSKLMRFMEACISADKKTKKGKRKRPSEVGKGEKDAH